MDKRNSPFEAILPPNSPQNTSSILCLNALCEAVCPNRKQSLQSNAIRPEGSHNVNDSILISSEQLPINTSSISKYSAAQQPQKQAPANIKTYASSRSSKQESMRFAYREEDSEVSKEFAEEFLRKMEESSIQIKQESHWTEEPRLIDIATKNLTHVRLNDQRKKIEEEKIKIQQEKNELDRKRLEIENLLKEYYQLREASEIQDSRRSATPVKSDLCNRTPSTTIRISERIGQSLSYRESFRDHSEQGLPTHSRQQKLEKDMQKLLDSKQKSKQKKARQALHLQNLWINMIKNQNETQMAQTRMVQDFFKKLKKINSISKFVQRLQQIMDSSAMVKKGLAFLRIKKTEPEPRSRTPLFRKSVVIKVTRRQPRESSIKREPRQTSITRQHTNQGSSRVCETEASRVEKFNEFNFNELNSPSETMTSLDFDRITCQSSRTGNKISRIQVNPVTKVTQIDMIIKNQLQRTKQQKILKDSNIELSSPARNKNSSGYTTSRASQGVCISGFKTQQPGYLTERKPQVKVNVFAAVATPSASRLVNSKVVSKKITLSRK